MIIAEYIKRESAIEAIMSDPPDAHYQSWYAEKINEIPAADVAPVVHGYWIDNGANGYKWAFICSRCGYVDGHPFDDRHNFCPSCGAKMDGGNENG